MTRMFRQAELLKAVAEWVRLTLKSAQSRGTSPRK